MYEKASAFDRIYRSLLLSKFFTKGWGNPATIKQVLSQDISYQLKVGCSNLKSNSSNSVLQFDFLRVLADRSSCQHLVNEHYPVNIDSDVEKGEVRIVDGNFRSPFDKYLPNVMPTEVRTARFQLIVPTQWPTQRKPVCIHMAGTGDHFFWRRRTFLARPLIKEYGIGSLLIENPFYGVRKPKEQLRSSLRHVNELFVMGGGLILEGLVMLHWCERQGFGPLGLTGISMGGHMASLAATNWHKPIPLIPCLSWSSATPAFTEGVLSGSIPWPVLVTQYMGQHLEYERKIMKKLQKCPKTDSFRLGQEFVWNYPESLDDLRRMQKRTETNPPPKPPDCNQNNSKEIQDNVTDDVTNFLRSPNIDRPMQESMPDQFDNNTSSTPKSNQENSAMNIWPIGKLDLQEAIVKSFSRPEKADSKSNIFDNMNEDEPSTCDTKANINSETSVQQASSTNPGFRHATSETVPSRRKDNIGHLHNSSDDQSSKTKASRDENKTAKERRKKVKKSKITDLENYQELKKEALDFMRGVMDVTTFVGNFSTPVDSSLVIVVSARKDGYIPRKGVPGLDEIWPGVEVRYLEGGHIAAFLFKQSEFRRAINDAFNKYLDKYEGERIPREGRSSNGES